MPLKICSKKMGSPCLFNLDLFAGNSKCFFPSCGQNVRNINDRQKSLQNLTKTLSPFVCQGYDSSVKGLRNYPILTSREF